jgi:hypothetical protein
MIDWYSEKLQELESSSQVLIYIYSTRSSSVSEKVASSSIISSSNSAQYDFEKHPEQRDGSLHRSLSIQSGRPNISNVITSFVEAADKSDRIAVTACGPDNMMSVTRRTVAGCIKPEGPSLELHCEQFGF